MVWGVFTSDFNPNHDPGNGQFTSGGGSANIVENSEVALQNLGKLKTDYIKEFFPDVRRADVIITDERIEHLKSRHPEDYVLFLKYGKSVIEEPDTIVKDAKNERTILLIKAIPDSNLEAVVRLSMNGDRETNENSVLSFHRLRERAAKKLIEKSEVLYKK